MKEQISKPYLLLILFLLLGCQSAKAPASEKREINKVETSPTQAENQLKLKHQIHEPANGNVDAPLLVLLHGRGSNESVFISMAPNLDRRLRVVSVQGPMKLGEGRFAWFDLQPNSDGLRVYNSAEVLAMSDSLVEFIEAFISKHLLKPKKVFIGGFSQGAIMSLGPGLRHPKVIDGVLCFSGALYPEFLSDFSLQAKHKDLSILVTHGKNDLVLPYTDIKSSVQFLKEKGLAIDFKEYESAHTFPPENFRDFIDWLAVELDN